MPKFSIGDDVIVIFPQRLTEEDRTIGVIERGATYDATIGCFDTDDKFAGPLWFVKFKDVLRMPRRESRWCCREGWLQHKGGPW